MDKIDDDEFKDGYVRSSAYDRLLANHELIKSELAELKLLADVFKQVADDNKKLGTENIEMKSVLSSIKQINLLDHISGAYVISGNDAKRIQRAWELLDRLTK
jgi:hypothetical protein